MFACTNTKDFKYFKCTFNLLKFGLFFLNNIPVGTYVAQQMGIIGVHNECKYNGALHACTVYMHL